MKVTDFSESRYAELEGIPLEDVEIQDSLLSDKMEINRSKSIPHQLSECERTGRIKNFKIAAGLAEGEVSEHLAADSDVYKILEGISYVLANTNKNKLQREMEKILDLIEKCQEGNGYINTSYQTGGGYLTQSYTTAEDESDRWKDLEHGHELYCGGHLIQAAIAHHRATGKRKFLRIAQRWADLVTEKFGPTARHGTGGHPEIEMALVELYRETGKEDYLNTAKFLLNIRGGKSSGLDGSKYLQDHKPIREQKELTGHAVRQLYLLSGITDIFAETGDDELWEVLSSQWKDLTDKKMAVTGGAGSRYNGEAFGEPYEITNRTGYYETCAGIASFMWNWRMLQVTGEAKYADVMERTLYNTILSGMSWNGREYFYTNPLEHDGGKDLAEQHRGSKRRTTDHFDGTACCPPNIARLLASLPGYVYGEGEKSLYVHHYVNSELNHRIGEKEVIITQGTRYPWKGDIKLGIYPERDLEFSLMLRIPNWAKNTEVRINGNTLNLEPRPGKYLEIHRKWESGDEVNLEFPMNIRKIVANPKVSGNTGCIGLMRGPIVYCIEEVDYPDSELYTVTLPKEAELTAEFDEKVLEDVIIIKGEGKSVPYTQSLYKDLENLNSRRIKSIDFTAIPYFAWANREPGAMRVWIPVTESVLR